MGSREVHGPRGGRGRGLALPAGRSDPRRTGRELAELAPMDARRCRTTRPPSTTRGHSRPAMPSYWVDNLRQPVRFAAAVQAALEDGYRVFGELSPHPLLTRAVEQTAQAADIAVQAVAGMRREQPLPHGLREFVAGPVQRGRRGGLLRPVSGRATAGRATADVDPPSASSSSPTAATPRRAGAPTRRRASAAGRARAAAGGARAARLAGRRGYRESCRGWPTTRSTTWPPTRAPPTARWHWPPPNRCSVTD